MELQYWRNRRSPGGWDDMVGREGCFFYWPGPAMRDPPCVRTRESCAPHALLYAGALYACCCCCCSSCRRRRCCGQHSLSLACAAGAAARTILLHLPLLGVLLIRPALRPYYTGHPIFPPSATQKNIPSSPATSLEIQPNVEHFGLCCHGPRLSCTVAWSPNLCLQTWCPA